MTTTNEKPSPFEALKLLAEDELNLVDELALELIQNKQELIPQVSAHTIRAGGKRLRPLLTLICAKMCGYKGQSHIDLAASVEFFHTATLLHDDVVDESKLRRGQNCANEIWGNKESILVGDFLLGKAFDLMGSANSITVYKILSNAAVIISEGEVHQLAATGNLEVNEEQYLEIIGAKTAALFAAACEIGAVLSGVDTNRCKALYDFGYKLGLAFQIIDDVLDYDADTQILGKSVGDDFNEHKMTLPVIYSYAQGSNEIKSLWEDKMNHGKDIAFEQLYSHMKQQEVIEQSVVKARSFIEDAKQQLASFEESTYKSALINVSDYVIDRTY